MRKIRSCQSLSDEVTSTGVSRPVASRRRPSSAFASDLRLVRGLWDFRKKLGVSGRRILV